MNALPSTQEIDSLYFALTSFNEASTSMHFFNTVLFLFVDPRVGLFLMSLMELKLASAVKMVEEKI